MGITFWDYTPAGGVEPPDIRFAGEGINRSATPAFFTSVKYRVQVQKLYEEG
jgi:hypothetical protein